jgi:AAA domain-containing protein/TrwC relaxase
VAAVLTISSGHSAEYLTGAVAAGRENYYTGAVAAGEPPGRWYGRGAEALGLRGLVGTQDMTALYERYLDPRDAAFRDPRRWDGAAMLGHAGRQYQTEEEVYAKALEAEPNADPERRAELRVEAGKRARRNVSFHDATFSVQKSVTVLHAAFEAQEVRARRAAEAATAHELAARVSGDTAAADRYAGEHTRAHTAEMSWAAHRTAVEDAIWAGNRAALDFLAEHAGYSRVGHHGGVAGRYTDAHDWVVASFFQHDSRDHDPQLHIHNAILNRVQGADGVWRTLDGRALYAYRGAAGAVGERTMEEHLTRSLGIRFATRPDGKAREILGVPKHVVDLFSARRRAITAKAAGLVRSFSARFGREPNALELDRLQRQATFATRRAKSHDGESVEQRLERWDRELRAEVAGGLAEVAAGVLDLRQADQPAAEWSAAAIIETALATVQETKAAWTEGDLMRALSDALPDRLGNLPGPQIADLLTGLTRQAIDLAVPLDADRPGEDSLPPELRLAGGRSAYETPGARLYATPEHVHTERILATVAARGGAPALDQAAANAFVASLAEAGIELGADQAAAVRGVLTSGAALETLVGPAGTGKSFVVGALAKAWQDTGLWTGVSRRAIGLATSQIATEVLTGEGLAARNIARWLATQRRLTVGRPASQDLPWRLGAGDLIVVDEASMVTTADLAAIHHHAVQAGAKVLLTGDHRQLAAVGAGGAMDLIAGTAPTYELAEARRFHAAWEGPASLRLRERDQTVLADYHKHGRLLDAGTIDQAESSAARAWLADTFSGQRSLLIVDTNERAARLSAQLRTELVRLGRVAESGVPLGLQGTYAGVGDLIQARRNDWSLSGVDGNERGPVNREQYRVLATRPDGGLTVEPIAGGPPMTLPPEYVSKHVALAYASTVHAAEGLTVDTSHAVVTPSTTAEALYVALTRGRHTNTAHTTTRAIPPDAPAGATQRAVHRSPRATLALILDGAQPQRSALATAMDSAASAESVRTPAELLADAAELATAGRTARWFDQLTAEGHLTPAQRYAIAAEDGSTTLTRLLRRAEVAGHDARQVLHDAVTTRPLDDARQLTNVLHHRITEAVTLDPASDSYADWIPAVDDPSWRTYLTDLATAADDHRADLGHRLAAAPPPWALEALGEPPADDLDRDEWATKAGIIAAHRELTDHTDQATPLGPAPKPGQVEEYASWRAAWRALGRPEADRDELEMSDGQLRVRVRAYDRELAWAPRYVTHELAGTEQAAANHRETAAIRAAEAEAATTPADRARLHLEATEAAALAATLATRAEQLAQADTARALWYAHTAATRAAADRANAELSNRRATDDRENTLTTAEQWLTAQAEAVRAEDAHRQLTADYDLTDVSDARTADARAAEPRPSTDAPETAVPDIRDTASPQAATDTVRVPTAEETATAVARAQQALAELDQRAAEDSRHAEAEARAQQLTRWHADDQQAQGITPDREPVLAPTSHLD